MPNNRCLSHAILTINDFSISWQGRPSFAFSLFPVIGKVLHKIVLDVATEIIVAPNWPAQPPDEVTDIGSHFTTF